MWFTSDNAGPAAPEVMDALNACNNGYTSGYGAEEGMAQVTARIREIFESPEAAVYLVSTGTAANSIALATYSAPWSSIYCSDDAHVEWDECGAPEFFTGGAKLVTVDAKDGKMKPAALSKILENGTQSDVHQTQRGALTITNATELGAVYTPKEVEALTQIAKAYDLPCHMDGARFANAVVSANCTPAEMTWKSGIDVLSFGGTKNGCAGVEAVVMFDPEKAWEFELRRKRGGHLLSKHRYLSAQMDAYLKDDLWLSLAKSANTAAATLHAGLKSAGKKSVHGHAANMMFFRMKRAEHQRILDAGAHYYLWPHTATLDGDPDEEVTCRIVCNWSTRTDEISAFVQLARG
jgi:threonine aldolase